MFAMTRNGTVNPLLVLVTLLAYLASPGFGVGGGASALAQTTDDLERAREHYDFAEFSEALAILDEIPTEDQPEQRLRDLYILRARCQVGLGNSELAEDGFCAALAIDPDWRPDPVFFPSSEVVIFEQALDSCPEPEPVVPVVAVAATESQPEKKSTPWYKKPIVWIGAAVVVVVAIVVVSSGDDNGDGGDGDGDLPEFPPPPGDK